MYPRSVFQAASQFNCLEFPGPECKPEDGVTAYFCDRTQGPACALACGAGMFAALKPLSVFLSLFFVEFYFFAFDLFLFAFSLISLTCLVNILILIFITSFKFFFIVLFIYLFIYLSFRHYLLRDCISELLNEKN
jgi:hypothetical protein